MIKSVSQRSFAFSRHTERGVMNQEPTGIFCHPRDVLLSHIIIPSWQVNYDEVLRACIGKTHTTKWAHKHSITNKNGLPCTDTLVQMFARTSKVVPTSLFLLLQVWHVYGFVHTWFRYPKYQIIANYSTWYSVTTSTVIANRPWMFSMNLETKSTFFSSSEPQAFHNIQYCLIMSRDEANSPALSKRSAVSRRP